MINKNKHNISFLWSLIFFLCLAAPLWASPLVINAGANAKYAQIELSWPDTDPETKINYTAKIIGGSLIISFDDEFETNLSNWPKTLEKYVSEVATDNEQTTLIIGLTHNYEMQSFQQGNKIIVRLLNEELPQTARAKKTDTNEQIIKPTSVATRAGIHKEYQRLVFDWPHAVDYKITQESPEKLAVYFNKKTPINLKSMQNTMKNVGVKLSVEDSSTGQKIIITAPGAVMQKNYQEQNLVVLDLYAAPQQAKKSIPAPPPEPAKQEETATEQAEPTPAPAPEKTEQATAPEPEPAIIEPAINQPASASPLQSHVKPANVQKVSQKNLRPALPEGPVVPMKISKTNDMITLEFNWPEEVGSAVYRRAGYVWILFDKPARIRNEIVDKSVLGTIGLPEQIGAHEVTAMRLVVVPGLEPTIRQKDNRWVIGFVERSMEPDIAVSIYPILDNKENAILRIRANGLSKAVKFIDPDVGDQISIVPVTLPGLGVNGARHYPEFSMLPTVQGVVVVPRVNDLALQADDRGLFITRNGGLYMAREKELEASEQKLLEKSAAHAQNKNFASFMPRDPQTSFLKQEHQIWREIAASLPEGRNESRKKLAQLYFSYELFREANAIIDTIFTQNKTWQKDAELQAMRAIGYIQVGDYENAQDALANPAFDNVDEMSRWRGALAAETKNWPVAWEYFATAGFPPESIPEHSRFYLVQKAIESAIQAGKLQPAREWMEQLAAHFGTVEQRQYLAFLKGLLYKNENKLREAQEIFENLAEISNTWVRPRAKFEMLSLKLENGDGDVDNLIKEMERLRYAWKDGKLEHDILKTLGHLQITHKKYRDGLVTLRRAVMRYPYAEETGQITQTMTDSFTRLFLEGEADQLSPLTALSIYDEFRELTPPGREGDEMIRRLADRMVEVDLLDRAADLLSYQLNYRLENEDKPRVGTQLALIYLLDKQPEKALKALNDSDVGEMSLTLRNERRLMQSRAYYEMEKYQRALELIASLTTPESDMLRADIFWRMGNWSAAAWAYEKLVAQSRPNVVRGLDANQSNLLLNWTTSLVLSRNELGVKAVRDEYLAAMNNTAYGETFDFLTRPDTQMELGATTVQKKLNEIQNAEAFLTNYRDKLKNKKLSDLN